MTIPGVGAYMLNAGTGNLMLQANDMDVPNRGLDFAFRRTYNSQSRHNYGGDDGSIPSNYGAGWSNNWNAHIAESDTGISVARILRSWLGARPEPLADIAATRNPRRRFHARGCGS